MITLSINLFRDILLRNDINPALSECPIQELVPTFIEVVRNLLIIGAVLAFVAGIMLSVFYYLTAYGNDDQVKKGKQTLQWTFIGALVVVMSAFVVNGVVSLVADPNQDNGAATAVVKKDVSNTIFERTTGQCDNSTDDSGSNTTDTADKATDKTDSTTNKK